jgi:hypothetical protein
VGAVLGHRLGGSAGGAVRAAGAARSGKRFRGSRPPDRALTNADYLVLGDLSCNGWEISNPYASQIAIGVTFSPTSLSALRIEALRKKLESFFTGI